MTVQRAWYTAQEIATVLSVSTQTVYNWCAAGVLPAVKIGGTLRIDKEAFDAYHEALKADARGGMQCESGERALYTSGTPTSDLSRRSSMRIVPRDRSTGGRKRRQSATEQQPSEKRTLGGWARGAGSQ